jgi:protein O-mannosyl-transferase
MTGSDQEKRWLPAAVALAIAIATFAVYFTILHNNFILWDDNLYIYQNPALEKPFLEAIPYFFGSHFFIGNYHPLTMILYALLYRVAGKQPEVFHTASLLIHVLNVLLVFWFIWLLSGRKLIVAAVTSLLFGIHPMHVESVAWAAELKDVLYAAFFMAGLITYLKYLKPEDAFEAKRPVSLLVFTFIFFLCSVLSKPAAVTFPLLLWVIDFYCKRPVDKRMIREKIPFLIVAVIFGIIAIVAQQEDHLLHDYYPFYLKIMFASYSLLAYIAKLFVPVNLVNIYPYPALHNGWAPWYFYFAPAVVGLLVYCIYPATGATRRLLVFCALFFFVTIVLALQLISVGDAIMAERYTYIPGIGLFFALGTGVHFLWHNGEANKKKMIRQIIVVALASVSLIYAACTYARCQVWRSSETLATDLYHKQPQAPVAVHNMGAVWYNLGKYKAAIPFFTVLKNDKHFTNDYLFLANSYIAVHEPDSAYYVLETARPGEVKNTREYYLSLAREMLADRRYEPAAMFLTVYTRLQKNDAQGYIELAQCYYMLHMRDRYISTIDSGLKYCPDHYSLLNHKGYSLLQEGKYNLAIPYFEQALKNAPGYEKATHNLATCYHAIDSINGKK